MSIAIAKSAQALLLAGDSHKIGLVSLPWKEGGVIDPPLSESTGTPFFLLSFLPDVYKLFPAPCLQQVVKWLNEEETPAMERSLPRLGGTLLLCSSQGHLNSCKEPNELIGSSIYIWVKLFLIVIAICILGG